MKNSILSSILKKVKEEKVKEDGSGSNLYFAHEAWEKVKEDGRNLYHVPLQSEKMCLAAIKKNCWLLKEVHVQTDAICLAAVEQNGLTLGLVRRQTEEICRAAIKQNKDAIKLIRDTEMFEKLQSEIDPKFFE